MPHPPDHPPLPDHEMQLVVALSAAIVELINEQRIPAGVWMTACQDLVLQGFIQLRYALGDAVVVANMQRLVDRVTVMKDAPTAQAMEQVALFHADYVADEHARG